jgi:hypothetical protein
MGKRYDFLAKKFLSSKTDYQFSIIILDSISLIIGAFIGISYHP